MKNRAGTKGKKRKRDKGEVLENVMMKAMTGGLRDSDKMFIDLDEKRMKFEENQNVNSSYGWYKVEWGK